MGEKCDRSDGCGGNPNGGEPVAPDDSMPAPL
jgi:hypothetical protein